MGAWQRWQDWATVGVGAIALATPFVFGADLGSAAAWTAYVVGAVLVAGGLWSASTSMANVLIEWIPLFAGLGLFISPWILGFAADPAMAWMSWILGGIVIVNSGLELLFQPQPSLA